MWHRSDRRKVFGDLLATLTLSDARKATKFISPTFVAKATRRHRPDKRDRQWEILVTFGRPNAVEREAIKILRRAGEPFPVRKIGLTWWPKKR